MTARLVRGGIALATMGGAMALGFTSPASAADTGIPVLEKIKQCESGGDYQAENPTSTASGAYQFIDSTFQALTASQGYQHAADAPEAVQDAAAIELYNEQGTAPWAPSASCWQAAGATGPASQGTGSGDRGESAHAATADSHSAHWGTKHRTSGTGSSGGASTGGAQTGGVQTGGSSTDQDADDSTQAPVQQPAPTTTTEAPSASETPSEPTDAPEVPTDATETSSDTTEAPAESTGVDVPDAPVQDVPQAEASDAGSTAVGGTPVATP